MAVSKVLYDCQPLQFHGHNLNAFRTSNQGSFVDMLIKLLILAVTQRIFGPAGETTYLGRYREGFRSSEKLTDLETAKVCSFQSDCETALY